MNDLDVNFSKLVCYKCSSLLIDRAHEFIISSHSENLKNFSPIVEEGSCENTTVWFIKDECLPEWIRNLVEESGWTKGRMNCPACSCRIGGFDYVGGDRCSCEESMVLPPIHFTRSKVDLKVATLV